MIEGSDYQALATVMAENNLLENGLGGDQRKYFAFQDETGWRVGVCGLELYGDVGVLNAFITMSCHRGGLVSGQMLEELTACAYALGVRTLCLFAREDDDFFADHAFRTAAAKAVPAAIRTSARYAERDGARRFMMRDLR